MKKDLLHFFKAVALVAICGVAFTSCSEDNDILVFTVQLNQTELEYDENGVWADVATNNSIQSQYLVFKHEGEMSPWGLIWQGFTPSRSADTNLYPDSWLDHQFNAMTGGGMCGKGTPFFVGFWNSQETDETSLADRTCHIYYSKTIGGVKESFTPISAYITNTCYTYYTMKDGDAYCKKFEKGDYFSITFHGVKADGKEAPNTVTAYLADCSTDDESTWFLKEWTPVNLEALGEVTDIYCTMESSDEGQWGMNTPAYFCLDWLVVRTILPQE